MQRAESAFAGGRNVAWRRFYPGIWMLPGVLVLCILFWYPLVRVVTISFLSRFPGPGHFTVANYTSFLTDSYSLGILARTFLLGALVTAGCAVLGYPVAYYFVRSHSRYKPLLFVAIIFPELVSIVVRTLGWYTVLGDNGLLNSLLLGLRVITHPLPLLFNFGTVIIGLIHVQLPFMILSIASVLGKIDPPVEESAHVLGANQWQTFLRVTLPLSLPGLGAGSLLAFALTIGAYVTPQLLGGGHVQTLAISIYDRMLVSLNWPEAAASAVILLVSASIVGLLYFRLLDPGTARRREGT